MHQLYPMKTFYLKKLSRDKIEDRDIMRNKQDNLARKGFGGLDYMNFLLTTPSSDVSNVFFSCYLVMFEEKEIGFTMIHKVRKGFGNLDKTCSYSYATFEEYRGLGLGKLAYREIAEFIFQQVPDLETLQVAIDHDNDVSIKIAESIGYQLVSEFRHQEYGLYELNRAQLLLESSNESSLNSNILTMKKH